MLLSKFWVRRLRSTSLAPTAQPLWLRRSSSGEEDLIVSIVFDAFLSRTLEAVVQKIGLLQFNSNQIVCCWHI